MRAFIVATIVVIFANAAIAADSGTTQLSFFTSNIGYGSSKGQSQWRGGAGLAISRAWSSRWSAELAVAAQRESGAFTVFDAIGGSSGPLPVTRLRSLLRVDAMRLMRSDKVNYDPLLRTSFGVTFPF